MVEQKKPSHAIYDHGIRARYGSEKLKRLRKCQQLDKLTFGGRLSDRMSRQKSLDVDEKKMPKVSTHGHLVLNRR